GSVLLVILYFFLIYRMIRATYKSNNAFYIYISTGVIMMFLFHIFENIGAAAGVVPLTGIPLPLVSQGGSALIADIIAIGLVLSMKYNQLPDFATTDQDMKNKLAKKRIQRAKQRQKKKDTDKK
ncbi:MAG: FtsW/RodA/SpoVE family cell cycle protein, partial [Streptococcaceae bacterium]|nr:FtsW/RodA/SpoVE family cell cycle protein [Streptococcaceae bacterium]